MRKTPKPDRSTNLGGGSTIETGAELSGGTISQERLDYQHRVGATYAIGLLDDPDFVALHCETLDDLLLEHADGRFVCIQVTSKDANLPPFRARDEKVIHTFANFCVIERDHGESIIRYTFVASCGFHSEKPDDQCLQKVIEKARQVPSDEYPSDALIKKFHRAISQRVDAATLSHLHSVFEKVELVNYPALHGAKDALYTAISISLTDRDPLPAAVSEIMQALETVVHRAATRDIGIDNFAYIAAARGISTIDSAKVSAKRIDRQAISTVVVDALSKQDTLPRRSAHLTADAFPNIRRKLTLNGASDPSIIAVQQSAFHAEFEHRSRQIATKAIAADSYRAKLRVVAARLYSSVYNDLSESGTPQAPQIYKELEHRLPEAARSRRAELPFLDAEELLGTIALMTEECLYPWGPDAGVAKPA